MKHVCLNAHRMNRESSAILAIESYYKKGGFLNHFVYTKLILLSTIKLQFLSRTVQIYKFLTANCRCCTCLLQQLSFSPFHSVDYATVFCV